MSITNHVAKRLTVAENLQPTEEAAVTTIPEVKDARDDDPKELSTTLKVTV